jgi:HlyD family secretion protein
VRQSPQTVQNVVTYDVVVSIDNSDLALKPGMTAANRIVTDQRTDVLRVPSQALRYAPVTAGASRRSATSGRPRPAEQSRVWVLRDGKPVRIAVTAGLDDDTYTEVVKGDIKPGDQVIIAEQRSTNSGRPAAPRLM